MSHPYKGIPKSEWPSAKAKAEVPPPFVAENSAIPLQPERINSDTEYDGGAINTEGDIPRNLFSGQMQKMTVMGKNGSLTDPIPGYVLYWFNDEGGTGIRIQQAKRSGYEHVKSDEVDFFENLVPGNNDLGSNVRLAVSPGPPPMYAYLMKKPVSIHEAHQKQAEKYHQRIEQELLAGTHGATADQRRYTRDQFPRSALPKIEIER